MDQCIQCNLKIVFIGTRQNALFKIHLENKYLNILTTEKPDDVDIPAGELKKVNGQTVFSPVMTREEILEAGKKRPFKKFITFPIDTEALKNAASK